jgi:hypothetical protein
MQILNVEQGTAEWLEARRGLVTCSDLWKVMAGGQTRKTYMYELIGQRLSGGLEGSFTTQATERGKTYEPIVRELYEIQNLELILEAGFIINHGIGYSPDGLVGKDGIIEIKTKTHRLQCELLINGSISKEHFHQVKGGIWVSERKWGDYISYSEGLPTYEERLVLDEEERERYEQEVTTFNIELEEKINIILDKYPSFFEDLRG